MMKSLLKKAAVLLIAVLILAGWFVRRNTRQAVFSFEGKPRGVLHDLKIDSSQKAQLAITTSGMISMLAVEGAEDEQRLVLTVSHDGGDSFSAPTPVSEPGAVVKSHGENTPSLAQTAMSTYAVWQETKDNEHTQVVFARSTNMGRSFEKPVVITDKTKPSFNGFSTMKVAPDGDIYVVWLDGRDQPEPKGTFGVYLSKSTDKGQTFSPNMRVSLGACPCCRPTITFGDKGEVYVAWRKVFSGDIRDMVLAASSDGGKTFSTPVKMAEDNWELHACPDSGPSLVTTGGRIYAAWYSEGNGKPGIRIAVSKDSGRSFSKTEIASTKIVDANHPQLSVSEDGRVVLVFQGRAEAKDKEQWNQVQPFVAAVDESGDVSLPQPLTTVHRSAAYPFVLSAGAGRVMVAWTEMSGDSHEVELCRGRVITN
jgi:hypothetical protein